MKILAADDEILQLNKLERAIAKAVPSAEIVAFSDSTALLEQIKSGNTADTNVAFLDIEMGAVSGIRIAKKLQAVNSKINIVFVTGFLEYASDAFELRASGYVSKPATEQKIRAEIDNLRYPMPKPQSGKKIQARCFGYFDVTSDGKPLTFKREKTKELFAYLIDRRGMYAERDLLRSVGRRKDGLSSPAHQRPAGNAKGCRRAGRLYLSLQGIPYRAGAD